VQNGQEHGRHQGGRGREGWRLVSHKTSGKTASNFEVISHICAKLIMMIGGDGLVTFTSSTEDSTHCYEITGKGKNFELFFERQREICESTLDF
jgi:hypothetical protein